MSLTRWQKVLSAASAGMFRHCPVSSYSQPWSGHRSPLSSGMPNSMLTRRWAQRPRDEPSRPLRSLYSTRSSPNRRTDFVGLFFNSAAVDRVPVAAHRAGPSRSQRLRRVSRSFSSTDSIRARPHSRCARSALIVVTVVPLIVSIGMKSAGGMRLALPRFFSSPSKYSRTAWILFRSIRFDCDGRQRQIAAAGART